jgi:DNA-binding HxlR family transcriptional regulator
MRAGAHALTLLSNPLTVQVLSALQEEPRALMDLRRDVGLPPQTTMRGHLRTLTRTRILERRQEAGFPGAVEYALAPAGRDLWGAAQPLQGWLARCPNGPEALDSPAAKPLIKALVQGWSSSIVRALASRPLSLTELNKLITGINYPSLERRMGGLRSAGLIEPAPGDSRTRPYRAGVWLRQAVAPLAAAARWERRHVPEETTPIGRIDIEAAFLLALPMLRLPSGLAAGCRLVVDTRAAEPGMAGVTARFSDGQLRSCVTVLEGEVDAGVSGGAMAWIDAIDHPDPSRLELRGDRNLAREVVEGLNRALLPAREPISLNRRAVSAAR